MANKSYHKLNNILLSSIEKYIINREDIYNHFNFSHNRQKHSLKCVLSELLEIIKYAKPYRSSTKIPHSTLKDSYDMLCKYNVFEGTYIALLNKYIKSCPSKKLKKRYTDTTCIVNKYGSDKVKYFGHKKRKVTKISFETDSFGIPIKMTVNNGSKNDGKILCNDLTQPYLIDKNILDKHKKYFLADSLYDTNEIRKKLIDDNQYPIIAHNIKNTKDEQKLAKKVFNKQEKILYVSRMKIEHYNGLIKSFRRVQTRYDRKELCFKNTIYFAMIDRILKV